MSIVLIGSTSGSITLQEPAVAGTTVLDLPATSGNVVVDLATQTLTNKTLTSPTFGGTPTGVGVLTSGTAVASTSGTSIDFTSIPSWVKRITVMFDGVSTNGSSIPLIRIGDSGGIASTGYDTGSWSNNTTGNSSTTAFLIAGANGSTYIINGNATLTNVSGNIWVFSSVTGGSSVGVQLGAGNKTLSATLDRIRITTVNGTDTFDAGSINILYE